MNPPVWILARLALLLLVVAPTATWFLVKPVRVVAPELAGVACPVPSVCVDDVAALERAVALRAEAVAFVTYALTPLRGAPKVVFCATEACARAFGLGARSAVTVGTIGTVIGPRAWTPYYIRHELIHQLQAEQLGVVSLLLKPAWLVEGMAYALSEDPRAPLPEPHETWRSRFRAWHGTVENAGIWERAREL